MGGPKYMHWTTKLQLIHSHAQEKTIDNTFPRNESSSSIKCKQMASINVNMLDDIIITASYKTVRGMNGKIGCVGYNNGEIFFVALLSPLFWTL